MIDLQPMYLVAFLLHYFVLSPSLGQPSFIVADFCSAVFNNLSLNYVYTVSLICLIYWWILTESIQFLNHKSQYFLTLRCLATIYDYSYDKYTD